MADSYDLDGMELMKAIVETFTHRETNFDDIAAFDDNFTKDETRQQRWRAFIKKKKALVKVEFEEKQNRQIYWDDVAMFCHPDDFKLGIRPMNASDIIEVDNLAELIALDESYKKYEEEK